MNIVTITLQKRIMAGALKTTHCESAPGTTQTASCIGKYR